MSGPAPGPAAGDAPLRIATRGSELARWQAQRVAKLLGGAVEFVIVTTTGDERVDVPLAALGGRGVFVKEVQQAVLDGRADIAVHSAKDLPAAPELQPPGLALAAFPERGDARDALVGATLTSLPPGARVGTGSARRLAQLAHERPDLTFAGLRGNIATRMKLVGEFDAIVVAAAALERLGRLEEATQILAVDAFVPQVGQGALAVECRADDRATRQRLAAIDDPRVRRTVEAERAFLAALGGGCDLPVGAHAVDAGAGLELTGLLCSPDGRILLRHTRTGDAPEALGAEVAAYLLDSAGGAELLLSDAEP